MADLRTDYKDDVLNINTNERRKYRMINNADGTISFEDVTDYVQNGDSFGSNDVNAITERVNRSLTGADVVDNLESTATDLPLSANMGRELKEKTKWTKLWENQDISAPFAAQDVQIDLSNYSLVAIEYAIANNIIRGIIDFCFVEKTIPLYALGYQQNTIYLRTRECSVSRNAVSFQNGYINGAQNDGYCIPIAIYGVW